MCITLSIPHPADTSTPCPDQTHLPTNQPTPHHPLQTPRLLHFTLYTSHNAASAEGTRVGVACGPLPGGAGRHGDPDRGRFSCRMQSLRPSRSTWSFCPQQATLPGQTSVHRQWCPVHVCRTHQHTCACSQQRCRTGTLLQGRR